MRLRIYTFHNIDSLKTVTQEYQSAGDIPALAGRKIPRQSLSATCQYQAGIRRHAARQVAG